MTRKTMLMLRNLLLVAVLVASLFHEGVAGAADADPVVLTFATVGDSRHDPEAADITDQDRIWLQNSKVLTRMIREMQAVKPNLLFFNGDMIMGYSTNAHILNRQYAFWRGAVATLFETGTYVLPVPGNHESQEAFTDKNGKTVKLARQPNESAWRVNMGDIVIDTKRWREILGGPIEAWNPANTPKIGGDDMIVSDQSQMTYSFDFRSLHFVVINTDAVGNDAKAPLAWLADDLARAKNRGVKRIFIFGHRPAYTYKYAMNTTHVGLDIFPDIQKGFWDLVEAYDAAYFCGHEHIFNAMQPRAATGGKSWQILAGSGGSPFDVKPGETSNPLDRTYAWVLVSVHASGKARAEVFGFDDSFGPTRKVMEIAP